MTQKQIYQEHECENGVTVSLLQEWEYGDVKQIWVQQTFADGSGKEALGFKLDFTEAAKYYNYLVTKNNHWG